MEGRQGRVGGWLKTQSIQSILRTALKEISGGVRQRHREMEFQWVGIERLKAQPPMVGGL